MKDSREFLEEEGESGSARRNRECEAAVCWVLKQEEDKERPSMKNLEGCA